MWRLSYEKKKDGEACGDVYYEKIGFGEDCVDFSKEEHWIWGRLSRFRRKKRIWENGCGDCPMTKYDLGNLSDLANRKHRKDVYRNCLKIHFRNS